MEQKVAWDQMWKNGVPPGQMWDKERSSPYFTQYLNNTKIEAKGKALVPGCGRGYDVVSFAQKGLDATGLEISETAKKEADQYIESQKHTFPEGSAQIIIHDFFKFEGQYDYIFDYTFFCAIEPYLRDRWAEQMAKLVKPGGILITIIYPISENDPNQALKPPFPLKKEHYQSRLEKNFDLISMDDIPAELSHEERIGREAFAVWKRK